MAACSTACSVPGTCSGDEPRAPRARRRRPCTRTPGSRGGSAAGRAARGRATSACARRCARSRRPDSSTSTAPRCSCTRPIVRVASVDEDLDVRLGSHLGVLVAVDGLDDGGAVVEVERHDPVRLALVQVDRAGVHQLERARLRRRCRPAGRRRRRCGTRPTSPMRRPMPGAGAPRPLQTARRFAQHEPVVERRAGARPRRGRRPTTARRRATSGASYAAQARWGSSTNGFARLTTAGSGGRVKTSRGWAMSHWSSWSSPATSTASDRCVVRPARPGLLPHRGDGAGEAVEHAGVEPADVDAELERGRGHDAGELAVEQLGLDLAPLGRQVAAAVGPHAARRGRRRAGAGTAPATTSVALRLRQNATVRAPSSTSAAVSAARLDVR